MKKVLLHLDNAIEEIEEAHEVAPYGTGMMISEILSDLRALRGRVNRIIERHEEQDS